MKRPLFLACLFFCLLTVGFSHATIWLQDCDKIEAETEVVNTSNGLDNGQVEVKVTKGSERGIKYIFCVVSGKVLNESRFEINILTGLPAGDYFCLISNADCTKKINFTIK